MPSATPNCAPPPWTQAFSGARPFDEAMGDYQCDPRRARAADVRVHHPAGGSATAAAGVGAAVRRRAGNQDAMDGFTRIDGRDLSPAEFFAR